MPAKITAAARTEAPSSRTVPWAASRGADDQEAFDDLAEGLVTYLRSPDIVGLEEIQDNSSETDDGVVDAEFEEVKDDKK